MSLLKRFLSEIRQQVREQQGDRLAAWLQVEPSAPRQYHVLADELRTAFADSKALDNAIDSHLPIEDDVPDGQATVWPGFQAFVKEYLVLWRDIDHDDLLGAHELLSALVKSASPFSSPLSPLPFLLSPLSPLLLPMLLLFHAHIPPPRAENWTSSASSTAFSHPQYGAMLIQVCKSLSESLARFTLELNRRPDLTRRLRVRDDDGGSKSVAESSAEIIQKIFKVCLMDRTAGRTPEGKKACVYMFANLVLKLLFACKRTNLATMIFRNMSASCPPLRLYPASQRVTYLYYLGRFNFSMNHYLRASLCLEQAYLQTPPQLASHRTKILTFLIPCNMLLGRFPSAVLTQRPEAQTLTPIFLPLCHAVRSANFMAFQSHLELHRRWLWAKGLYAQLCYRLRPLLWRSLARKTFLLTYVPPTEADSRKAATLDLACLHAVAVFVQRQLEGWLPSNRIVRDRRPSNVNAVFMQAITSNVQVPAETTLVPPPGGPRKLRANEGLVCGNMPVRLLDVEMMVATLIQRDFMHGFIAHVQGRFAIIGAKAKGPLLAGWPGVWQAICEHKYDQPYDPNEVPGWVKT
ncbi:PCI domain-containing protein [Drechmeria coniospora]|uniref:PCI domain-containing protein n=1 Tax=Drechmeria coniospora TaxID=98403 RepID=A0A151GQE3_DRECN|nr:PCI domain-containing protein [Drechmeria coniospora]KYK59316.1 PCI domain-containing protein [Drechmeria coniospora]